MAWLAVDESGKEYVSVSKPCRIWPLGAWSVSCENNFDVNVVELPKGSIKKLIGRELTWEDEPVELKEE